MIGRQQQQIRDELFGVDDQETSGKKTSKVDSPTKEMDVQLVVRGHFVNLPFCQISLATKGLTYPT